MDSWPRPLIGRMLFSLVLASAPWWWDSCWWQPEVEDDVDVDVALLLALGRDETAPRMDEGGGSVLSSATRAETRARRREYDRERNSLLADASSAEEDEKGDMLANYPVAPWTKPYVSGVYRLP